MTSQKFIQIIFVLVCLAVFQGTAWSHGGDWYDDESGNKCENTKYCWNGNEVDLGCPEGYMIDVSSAVYKGRWGGYHRQWKRCGDPNACEKVRNLCNGEDRCQFHCNDELFNETTCTWKRESLKVDYQCIPDPCKMFCCANGGVCKLDSDMMPMCECSGSWNGTHCEDNPCDGMLCQNNGTCLVNMADGTAQCCCTSGFTGENCETAVSVDACSSVQCQNDGTCTVNILGQPVCACPTGFGGQLCEIDCSIAVPCPAGFQELPPGSGRCYSICPVNSQSWLAAQVTCLGLAATLWEPNDAAEVLAVQSALDVSEQYWTGAFDGVAEGTTNFVGSGVPFPVALTIEDNTAEKDCVEYNRVTVAEGWKFRYRTCTVTTRKCICEIPSPCQATGPTIPIFPVSP